MFMIPRLENKAHQEPKTTSHALEPPSGNVTTSWTPLVRGSAVAVEKMVFVDAMELSDLAWRRSKLISMTDWNIDTQGTIQNGDYNDRQSSTLVTRIREEDRGVLKERRDWN